MASASGWPSIHDTLAQGLTGVVTQRFRRRRRGWGLVEGERRAGDGGQPRRGQAAASETEVTLLRVAQEALANAGPHAAASAVALTLAFGDGQVSLDVTDDGVGFDSAAPPSGNGSGGYGLTRHARAGGRPAGQPGRGERPRPGHHRGGHHPGR